MFEQCVLLLWLTNDTSTWGLREIQIMHQQRFAVKFLSMDIYVFTFRHSPHIFDFAVKSAIFVNT